MTAFRFQAARSDGQMVKGALDAASRAEAAATLSARGLFPVVVEPSPERPRRWRRPNPRAAATVIQSLATLVDAGVPLAPALDATRALATGQLGDALERVASRVRQGASLGAAMADEGVCFSGLTVGLVRAGERGVGLGPALLQAAAQLERQAETGARVRAALAYPLLLATVGTLSVGLIVLFVVPRFAAILGDLGQALPPATRALIGLSEGARRYGLLAGALAVPLVVAAARARRRHLAAWHATLLRLPVLGPLRQGLATARVTRTLGALLQTGTPALAALAIARDAAGDEAIAARLTEAREQVAEGAALTAALSHTRAATEGALQLAAIGEGSGRLPALLAKAADLEEQGAERRLETLVRLLEPALIIAFAVAVAFVAAALLQAVYAVRPT
jgi:general secretion pathway protein F